MLVATAVLTLVVLFLLNPLAKHVRLLDHPDGDRKLHAGSVPLTGGIVLLVTLLIVFAASSLSDAPLTNADNFWSVTAIVLTLLVLIHAIDDVIEMRALSRFTIDALLAFGLWSYASVQLFSLGDLFGLGEIVIVRSAILMTIFSFVAASNAFNMVDGIDSLCSGLGLVCFGTLVTMILLSGSPVDAPLVEILLVVMAALVVLYLANLGLLGPRLRIFLGDAGARLIGFIAAIALIQAAQAGMIRPVMAYFAIAVPVCDCLALMGQRALQGRSPLSADRLHLHHLLGDLGFSDSQVRRMIITSALGMSLFGFFFQITNTPEWVVSVFVVTTFAVFIGMRLWLIRRVATRA
ncbi:MAG: MraY family glycosyltransferase, partial [Pseudomonadales bacterium]